MDAKQVREWKAGYDELNRWELEERRKATPQERFQSLLVIWRRAQLLGHLGPKEQDLEVMKVWQALREAHARRSSFRPN